MNNSKHRFAFFASLEAVKKDKKKIFPIEDGDLVKRIDSILRMKQGDFVTLFDENMIAHVVLEEVTKKTVLYSIESISLIEHSKPQITCLLPLLKREALESAIERLSVLGVHAIQLVISEKFRHSLLPKELVRLQKIIIAGAEQSKSFAMPKLLGPQKLEDCIAHHMPHAFLFDQNGVSCREALLQKIAEPIMVAFGPEGDFTDQEKNLFLHNGYQSLLLTDSVLRTIDAVLLGIGLLRLS